MTPVVILIIFIILFYLYLHSPSTNQIYTLKNVLTKSECEEFISMAKTKHFLTTADPVDDKPVYQIEILENDRTLNYPELFEKCVDLYKKKLPKQKGTLDFVFLKRYTPGERVHIPMHVDMSKSTINVLLSDPTEFEGGDFYLFDDQNDTRVRDVKRASTLKTRIEMLKNMKDLPIIYMKQGDMINYDGYTFNHGILPVTSGERYVLTYFFDHT